MTVELGDEDRDEDRPKECEHAVRGEYRPYAGGVDSHLGHLSGRTRLVKLLFGFRPPRSTP